MNCANQEEFDNDHSLFSSMISLINEPTIESKYSDRQCSDPWLCDSLSSSSSITSLDYKVKQLALSWKVVAPINPSVFLSRLLESRGYDSSVIVLNKNLLKLSPTLKRQRDYDMDMIRTVKSSDVDKLQSLHGTGKNMSACNQFSESIVHMACRCSSVETVRFIVTHGGDVSQTDDLGRNAMHDVCWRAEQNFDIAAVVMDIRRDLVRCADSRGATPLHYVRKEHWMHWCAFLYLQREIYWPRHK